MHVARRGQVSLVHPQVAPAEADHHGTVAREAHALEPRGQPEFPQAHQQLSLVLRRRVQLQDELVPVASVPYPLHQRSKHLVTPGSKVPPDVDQTYTCTSIAPGVTEMTFTDDGRPPRDRFDTVPAVEITVPLFVCST